METDFTPEKFRYTIAGAARSGLSCAKLLKKFKAQVFLTDLNKISPETENFLKENEIDYECNGHSFEKIISNSDILIISPGILLSSPLVIKAKENNIPVVSEVEVASWFFPKNVECFGITGTNGKSTTTNYLADLLKLKYNAIACGNIGKPVSEIVLEILEKNSVKKHATESYYLCIELSSYQLETIYSLRPLCTSFLNLQNDHLARYETMNEYLKAKWRLILLTKDNGLAIIEENVLKQAILLGLSLPKCKIFVVTNEKNKEPISSKIKSELLLPIAIYKELKNLSLQQLLFPYEINTVKINYNTESNSANINFTTPTQYEWNIKNSCLNGIHNIANILNASLIADFLGLSKNIILKQWEKESTKYIQLPHRMEFIGKENQIFFDTNKTDKKVSIINDSKSTNVESTLVALRSFHKPIRLLLGGEPKGDSYLPIVSNQKTKFKVTVYPFGKAAPIISSELNGHIPMSAENYPNMLSAAKQALLDCESGDIILLSPACSSFDEFKDYEHRGNTFRSWAISCFKENKS